MPLNVLVVDDSAVMRGMIRKALHQSGLPLEQLLEAGDGEAGLQVMQETRVDVALVDLNMPVMDGEEMIGHMREDGRLRAIPILIVSTDSSPARMSRLADAVTGFIHKPFTPEALSGRIIELIGASHGF